MPDKIKECCSECRYKEIVPIEGYKHKCYNSSCDCHQQDNTITPEMVHRAILASNDDQREIIKRAEQQDNGLEEWEEEFEQLQYESDVRFVLVKMRAKLGDVAVDDMLEVYKTFIRSLLAKERKLVEDKFLIWHAHEITKMMERCERNVAAARKEAAAAEKAKWVEWADKLIEELNSRKGEENA